MNSNLKGVRQSGGWNNNAQYVVGSGPGKAAAVGLLPGGELDQKKASGDAAALGSVQAGRIE
jgi:hypothetical protein